MNGHGHRTPERLLERNRAWAAERTGEDPDYFSRLAEQHAPDFLWIGCSDARVPASTLVGLEPGEVFVHRNIANQVLPRDVNVRAVIDYAVGTLKVRHIFVVGHYGCGGVAAALSRQSLGVLDAWLADLRVKRQVMNVGRFATVQRAWREGRELHIHGWIYDIHDGLLKDLGVKLTSIEDVPEPWRLKL